MYFIEIVVHNSCTKTSKQAINVQRHIPCRYIKSNYLHMSSSCSV